jgi:hypothetical protein
MPALSSTFFPHCSIHSELSAIGWRFEPSGAPTGTSFDEMIRNFELQRDKEFTSHVCADHSKGGR